MLGIQRERRAWRRNHSQVPSPGWRRRAGLAWRESHVVRSRWKQGDGPPVLVLATTASLAYSTARCLQDVGRPFRLLSRGRYGAARTSRWCSGGERFAQSGLDDDALACQVMEALKAHELVCVVPAGIDATLYLARHRELFAQGRRRGAHYAGSGDKLPRRHQRRLPT